MERKCSARRRERKESLCCKWCNKENENDDKQNFPLLQRRLRYQCCPKEGRSADATSLDRANIEKEP